MKICITGGAGMIGSALLRKLSNKGYEIIVIDNLWRGKVENIWLQPTYFCFIRKSKNNHAGD